MQIKIWDPDRSNVYGFLVPNVPVYYNGILSGKPINLNIAATGSDDADKLFDLESPPAFHGPYMVWGVLNNGTKILTLYLAERTGDRAYPFADLRDFKAAATSGASGNEAGNGAGWLNRPNQLPQNISWALVA